LRACTTVTSTIWHIPKKEARGTRNFRQNCHLFINLECGVNCLDEQECHGRNLNWLEIFTAVITRILLFHLWSPQKRCVSNKCRLKKV
jgi:hypothetical protein